VPGAPASRRDLRQALVANALRKPANLLIPAALLAAGALIGVWWLAAVALVCWVVLAGGTFLDEDEAARVGDRLRAGRRRAAVMGVEPRSFAPEIARRVDAALAARAAIGEAIGAARLPLDDVALEVDSLVAAIAADAARAEPIHRFLLGEEAEDALARRVAAEPHDELRSALEAKAQALGRLRSRLGGLLAEIDRAVLALETIRAEILSAGDRAQAERRLADRASELRSRIELVAAGLEEAYEETRAGRG
jgi:methyl-accepting chemotaxis protein